MTEIELSASSFDAVVSVWAIIHVPVEEQPRLLNAIARWIRPKGILLLTTGDSEWTGTEDDWYGAPMYWSHGDHDWYADALAARGFEILQEWKIPEDEGAHSAFLARAASIPDGVGAPR